MNTTDVNTVTTALDVLRRAERELTDIMGQPVKLTINLNVIAQRPDPKEMLRVIATALGMKYADFKNPVRKRKYVDLRSIAVYFLRVHFPDISFSQHVEFFSYADHSTPSHAFAYTREMLDNPHLRPEFVELFILARNAVDKFLKR